MDGTDNKRIYNRARKSYLEKMGDIKCSICRYHKVENASKRQKNWKKFRRTKYKRIASMV